MSSEHVNHDGVRRSQSSVSDNTARTSDEAANMASAKAKHRRWLTIPRLASNSQPSRTRQAMSSLVRRVQQQSSPEFPRRLVEPPEPPPHLRTDLCWSTDPPKVPASTLLPTSERRSSLPTNGTNEHDSMGEDPLWGEMLYLNDASELCTDMLSKCQTTDAILDPMATSISSPPSAQPNTRAIRRFSFPTFEPSLKNRRGPRIPGRSTQSSRRPSVTTLGKDTDGASICTSPSLSFTLRCDPRKMVPDLYDPVTHKLILSFSTMRPRMVELKRRINPKQEYKALRVWRAEVLSCFLFNTHVPLSNLVSMPRSKRERYALTRQFILREFYTTEVKVWNQLHYTKVMFFDPLLLALERGSPFVHEIHADWFANLDGLMQFSANLIRALKNTHDAFIGDILCSMADEVIVFLRCALDYKANDKMLEAVQNNKGYTRYTEKLALRRETRQFTLRDYLIMPIQRVTRYRLLLTDLYKHTESTHPDYYNIIIAHRIITGLIDSMNYAQK